MSLLHAPWGWRFMPRCGMRRTSRFSVRRGSSSTSVRGDGVDLEVQADGKPSPLRLRTRLLVAADGGDSGVRGQLDLKVREHALRS